MNSQHKKWIVDTNVPLTANLNEGQCTSKDLERCVDACIMAVEHIVNEGILVIDDNDEILQEYLNNLPKNKKSGVGTAFFIWVITNAWNKSKIERVPIRKTGDEYTNFPPHIDLEKFDPSDKKFVATANAHPDKPPILQATDSKWWGWQKALNEKGITVQFLCSDYVQTMYKKKMG